VEATRFPLASADGVLVRADSSDLYGRVVTRGRREYIQRAHGQPRQSSESALNTICFVAAEAVPSQLARLDSTPEERRVEFGLELSTKAVPVLAATGAGARLRFALTHDRRSPTRRGHGARPARHRYAAVAAHARILRGCGGETEIGINVGAGEVRQCRFKMSSTRDGHGRETIGMTAAGRERSSSRTSEVRQKPQRTTALRNGW
jgi:hypothetical protein